jgi:ABC-type transport system involved in cytochrome c biogenesis permease subunit
VGRWIAFGLTLVVLAGTFLMAVKDMIPERSYVHFEDYEPWDARVLETGMGIPVQDGGRVKPLESYAGYMMLGLRGDRMITIIGKDDEKVKVTPTEWMLDALFRPHVAVKHPTFRIDNSEVIELIGLSAKAKRDRYTYEELLPARESLFQHGSDYERLAQQDTDLDTVQQQTLALARNVRLFETLLGYFTFARAGIELRDDEAGSEPGIQRLSTVMATADVIQQVMQEAQAKGEAPPARLQDLLRQVTELSNAAKFGFAVLPPPGDEKEWLSAGNRIWNVMTNSSGDPTGAIEDIGKLEMLVTLQAQGVGDFPAEFQKWRDGLEERARSRGEFKSVPLELSYNRGQWFFRALFYFFVPGAIFVVLSWIAPRSIWGIVMSVLVWITSVIGLVLLIVGITQRSLIMERPPVGNLYDTMPFITAGIILLALIAELLTRKRLALAVAPLLGFVGLVMARRYEFGDASDPMDPLLAVLRSNYWLTIHVLTITFGYAAGLVTAAMGHVYVFLRVFRLDGGNVSLRRTITRMTYGCLCFTLLLSLTGTVLGGIWANDSWGRFWGWDPKENGALMIVLWSLFVLHARMGGIIKEWGTNLWAVFGAVVVTFSWWHVNLLGVGLHSYGFSDSKKFAVFTFYSIEGIVLLFGIGFMIYDAGMRIAARAARGEKIGVGV